VIGRTGLVTISSTRPDTEFEKKPPFKVVAGPDVVVRWIFVEGACNEMSTHTQTHIPEYLHQTCVRVRQSLAV